MVSEFGRVPGALNGVEGRHHYNGTYIGLFAGGGVKPGQILGSTDAKGEKVLETGWKYKAQMKTENIYATAYSASASTGARRLQTRLQSASIATSILSAQPSFAWTTRSRRSSHNQCLYAFP